MVKVIYKITYPNGKIYIGKDLPIRCTKSPKAAFLGGLSLESTAL
jgi:hypothetical protein